MNQTVKQAETDLVAAQAALLEELQRDSERSEGSGAQERRRELRQQALRDEVDRCKSNLEAAKARASAAQRTS